MNVKDRAESVGTFRHVNVFLMETLAAWVPSTPEMEVKVLFGRHLWLAAQMADRLGRRARELRAPLNHDRAPAPGFAQALTALARLDATTARLQGLYGVALPAFAKAYSDYLATTAPVIDEPTVVILEDALRDIERMRKEHAALLEELAALKSPAAIDELKRLFASSGMVAPRLEEQPA